MAAANIKDRETLEAWLSDQPREVVLLIAARSALRLLPLFSRYPIHDVDEQRFRDKTAALFGATALARAAAKYPTLATEFRASARNAASRAYGAEAPYAAARAADAAYNAARATEAIDISALVDAATRAVVGISDHTRVLSAIENEATWEAVQADVARAEISGIQALIAATLWPEATHEPIGWAEDAWYALRARLPANENWDVWTVWYEDRLRGANYDEARELIFATVPLDMWEQGSAAANAYIRKKLDELEKRPEPKTSATLSVLFSYAWQPIDAQHRAQLDLYERLTQLVNQKPPEFASLPKIELWRDAERLENAHGAEAQIAAACDRAFLLLALMSRKYPTSDGCMREFDKFIDANGANLPGKQAVVVAANCRRSEAAARFSAGLRLWMLDDEDNTLVEAITRKEPAKDAFAHRVAEQIWRAAARHLGLDAADAGRRLSAPKAKTGAKRKPPAGERLQTFNYLPAWNELRVNESGRIGADPAVPRVRDASVSAEKERESEAEVCRKLAEAAADGLERGLFGNVRDPYLVDRLRRYADCVPTHNSQGNMVLASEWAGFIREHLKDHRAEWPRRCVTEIDKVLEHHEKLNPSFPAAQAATAFASDAHLLPPIDDATLADIPKAINEKPASDAFVPEVAEALAQSLAPTPRDPAKPQSEAPRGPREYEILTTLNRLVRVLDLGAKMNGTINLARQVLMPLIEKFLDTWMPHWPF